MNKGIIKTCNYDYFRLFVGVSYAAIEMLHALTSLHLTLTGSGCGISQEYSSLFDDSY